MLILIIISGLIAILYGYIVGNQILSASPGNKKMQEIASKPEIIIRFNIPTIYKTIFD